MSTLSVALCACVCWATIGSLLSAPVNHYDQRQEGENNVRAKVDNFIVLAIVGLPAGSSADSVGSLLLNLLLSRNTNRNHVSAQDRSSQKSESDTSPNGIQLNDVNFILKPSQIVLSNLLHTPKSADFPTVATSQLKTPSLEKTATDDVVPAVEINFDEVQKAVLSSQKIAVVPLTQGQELPAKEGPLEQAKTAKAISTTLRTDSKTTQMSWSKERNLLEERVKLLSAEIEICAPHERRGEDGNCEPIKSKHRNGPHEFSGGLTPEILSFGLSPATD